MALRHPVTPDGRYFIVKGRRWRLADPNVAESEKSALEFELKRIWRVVRTAKRNVDTEAGTAAHRDVDDAKYALGERGPVCLTSGDADLDRHLVKNTSYTDRCATLEAVGRSCGAS
jgi:hypothetical protein